jgi:hypothetical protein
VHRSKSGRLMSALGQERTSPAYLAMSALPLKADKQQTCRNVRFVPKADKRAAANEPLGLRLHGQIGCEDGCAGSCHVLGIGANI